MKKSVNPDRSIWHRIPKPVYGVALGTLVGALAVFATPNFAVSMLVGLVIVSGYVFLLKRQRKSGNGWSPSKFSPSPVMGALVVGIMSVAGVQYLGITLAWHPEGTIKKYVQNVTTGGPMSDANTNTTAVAVSPGDILNYTVVVSNVAPPAKNQYNDMAYTVMTDTLPAGMELVSDPSKRTITENLGTILPGKSVTKVYKVRVVANADGAYIENTACFKGDSVVRDRPQKGCDKAVTKTKVPVTPPTPTPTPTPPTPTPTPTPPTPTPTPTPPTPTPTPTPPTPTPTPTPTPPEPTPTPTPTPPESTTPTPTPTPPTSITPPTTPPETTPPESTPPPELPNVGARSMIVIALFAILTGYLVTALYGYRASNKAKQFN